MAAENIGSDEAEVSPVQMLNIRVTRANKKQGVRVVYVTGLLGRNRATATGEGKTVPLAVEDGLAKVTAKLTAS